MTARLYAIALVLAASYLVYAISLALPFESIFSAGPRMASDPWTWVTIVDLYLGFVVLGGIIVMRERRALRYLPWLVAVFCLGNVAGALYLAWALRRGRYDPAHVLGRG